MIGCSSPPTRSELAAMVKDPGKEVRSQDKKVAFWIPNNWTQDGKRWEAPKTKSSVRIKIESRFPEMKEHLSIIRESVKQERDQNRVTIVNEEYTSLNGRKAGLMTLKVTTPDTNYLTFYTAIDLAGTKYTLVIRCDEKNYKLEEQIIAKIVESYHQK